MSLVRFLAAPLGVAVAALPLLAQGPAPAPVPAPKPPPASAPAAANDPAWDAAMALKTKAAYADAARAFDAWAQANPDKPRAGEALTEAGVCLFSQGRAALKLLRPTKESKELFDAALQRFERVLALGATPYGARAQYMRGSVKFFAGDMPGAELEYGRVIDDWKNDAKYLPKAIERRAATRRNQLETVDALADLTRYAREFPQGDEIANVNQHLKYMGTFGKIAPPLRPEGWIQGDPTTLEALRGDVVVLYFFASWCENCEKARPFVLDLFERYEPMGVHFVGIVTHSKGQTVESVRPFLAEKKLRFPVMMDMRDSPTTEGGLTTQSYLGSKIPDVVILDRAGRVRWHDDPNNLPDSTLEALLIEDPAAGKAK